ncbi:MAG: metallophosphatase domain-containing protein [archaeon]|nr:metallophosphatase domain-containing protein [archaeon]
MAAHDGGEGTKRIRIVCISDTHNEHRKLDPMPAGDVLLSAGDISKFGRTEHIEDFNQWLGEQAYAAKVVVHGNHEQPNWPRPGAREMRDVITNGLVLNQSACTVHGLKVFGTRFCWPRKEWEHSEHWAEIPPDTDILLTHGPPEGILDGGSGCGALSRAIRKIKPRLVVFGHVHSAHGLLEGKGEYEGITFVNAAICGGDSYLPVYSPTIITLDI